MYKNDKALAYLVLRLALGVNFLMHGIVRIPKLSEFVSGVADGFADTWMPHVIVVSFAFFLPYAEALIGLLLLAGAWTRWALLAGGLLMSFLIFGKTLQQDWATVGTQMIYVMSFFFALFFTEFNHYSIDGMGTKSD